MAAMRRQDRIVMTATRAGTEKNATFFARYFVEALRDSTADTDKNEIISALEAFKYADQKTAKYYETQKRLSTEHAILEDTGKGEGLLAVRRGYDQISLIGQDQPLLQRRERRGRRAGSWGGEQPLGSILIRDHRGEGGVFVVRTGGGDGQHSLVLVAGLLPE